MGTRIDFNVTGCSEEDRDDDVSMQQSMGTGEMGAALAGVQVGLNQPYYNPHDERPVGGGSNPSNSTLERTAYQVYEERPAFNMTGQYDLTQFDDEFEFEDHYTEMDQATYDQD